MSTIVTRAVKGSALTFTEGDANFTNLNNDKIEDIVEDTTPQLGGNLDVNGNSIVSTSNADITIAPNGTGIVLVVSDLEVGYGTGTAAITSAGAYDLDLVTNGGTNSGLIRITDGVNGEILLQPNGTGVVTVTSDFNVTGSIKSGANSPVTIAPDGTGDVHLNTDSVRIGDNNADATIHTRGTGDLILTTNEGSGVEGIIRIYDGANGNITVSPNGTGSVVLDGLSYPQADGTANQVLKTNGSGVLGFVTITQATGNELENVVEDTTPQLGGNLDVQANSITTSTTDGDISIEPNGAGIVIAQADLVVGYGTTAANVSSAGAHDLVLSTNEGTDTGTITITDGVNGNISVTPNGTGKSVVSAINYNEGAIHTVTYASTITPNVTNGNVQTVTLTGNVTFNAFASPVAGQSLTLKVVQDATGSRTLTSTMKFAGASKTLSTAANSIDIISVYYDGTDYFASLAKGFA
jgi:hypothetical protein